MDTTAIADLQEEEDLEVSTPTPVDNDGDNTPAALQTVAQTTDQLRNAEDQLHELEFELQASRLAYRNLVGQATSDATRTALEAEATPRRDQAEAEITSTAARLERMARDVIAETEAAPPSLSPDDLRRASELKPFLSEDVERLSLPELRSRVRHALATGAIPEMYLLSRAVPIRIERERQQPGFAPESIGDLDALAREAGQRLPRNRSLMPLRERAEKVLYRSLDLHRDAGRRQSERDARTAMERALGGPGVPIPED